jgi:hypothetical protein
MHKVDYAHTITGFYGISNPLVMKDRSISNAAKVAVKLVLINWLASHGSWMGYRLKDLKRPKK